MIYEINWTPILLVAIIGYGIAMLLGWSILRDISNMAVGARMRPTLDRWERSKRKKD
jgi:hypothetical protein